MAIGYVDWKKTQILKTAFRFLSKRAGRGHRGGMKVWRVEKGVAFWDNVIRIISR